MRAPSLLVALALTSLGATTGCGDEALDPLDREELVATEDAPLVSVDDLADALPRGFERSLGDAWACGDLLLHVANPERSIMLTLYWPSLLDEAAVEPDADGWEVDVGGPDGREVAIVVHTGTRLDAGTCARQGEEPAVIDQTWTAVAEVGHLELETRDGAPRLSTWLWDMELRRAGDGATVVVEQLEQVGVALAG